MHYLILEKENHSYSFKESSDTSMKTLAWFLLYDADVHDIKWIKKWIVDPSREITTGNTTSLEKFEGKILITPEINEEHEEFEITVEGFVDLINSWSLLLQQKPEKIVVTKEGNNVIIEGKN